MINIYALSIITCTLFFFIQIYDLKLQKISRTKILRLQNLFAIQSFKSSYFIIFIFLLITQFAYINFETIDWDINSYLVSSQDILRGNLPYETQWESKQALFYYFYALIIKLSTGNLIVFKLINDLILFLITTILFLLIKHFTHSALKGLISSFLYLSMMSQPWASAEFSELYSLFFISSAYYLMVFAKVSKFNTFIIGLLLSSASLVNIGSALFVIPFIIHLFINNRNKVIFFILGTSFLHIIFFTIYLSSSQLDVYWSTLFVIPNAYRGGNMNFIRSMIDFLRSLYEYNVWFYVGILFLGVSLITNLINEKKLNNRVDFFKLTYLHFIITSLLFFYLASHGYYHHLIFFLFFLPFLIINLREIFSNLIFAMIISVGIFTTITTIGGTSIVNLINLEEINKNYPLKKLATEIDDQFNYEYTILAFDSLLVLFYLDKPNFSYIVHPSNHNELFITDNLKKIGRMNNEEPDQLVNLEPDVIICSNNEIIQCEIYDYKRNYFELDTLTYRQDPNLQFYDNQTYHFRVFIKDS